MEEGAVKKMGIRTEASRLEGRRHTEQRELILEILKGSKGHLDADEVYHRARQRSPGISLSTVYRNLRVFATLGLVEQRQFGSRFFYEAATRARHHHLMCLSCGRIFEFECSSTEGLKSRISQEEGFKVTEADVRLAGYCPDCQQRLSDDNNGDTAAIGKEEVR